MGHLSVFPTDSNIERNVPLETSWTLNNKLKVYLQTGVAKWSVIIYIYRISFFSHPVSPRHSLSTERKEDFQTVSCTQDFRLTCVHPLAVFPAHILSSLFLCLSLSHTCSAQRGLWSRAALVSATWSDYLCLGFHPPPQVPRGAAAGRRLHFISSCLLCAFPQREPCCRYSSAGLERKLSRDQCQWSSSH